MCILSSSVSQASASLTRVAEYLTLDVQVLLLALEQTARETRLSASVCLDLLDQVLAPAEPSSWTNQTQLALLELEWSTLSEPEAALISVQQALYQFLSHAGALQP